MITIKEAAERLNGNQYREEGSRELWAEMKSAGLVAVFGASDDLVEFEGAIRDEVGAYGGAEVRITPKGLLNPDDGEYSRAEKEVFPAIKALWCAEVEGSWTYETSIPHVCFNIYEDDELYCRGLVFSLSDMGQS